MKFRGPSLLEQIHWSREEEILHRLVNLVNRFSGRFLQLTERQLYSLFECHWRIRVSIVYRKGTKYITDIICQVVMQLYYIHFEITGDPCNLIGSQQCNFFLESHNFFSKLDLLFSSQWESNAETKQSIQLSRFVN